uniref:Uncharacterized protein n=1 Tax=Pavo cristatus TaxID=9049 RepID=A0A8C9G5L7_PAVCR
WKTTDERIKENPPPRRFKINWMNLQHAGTGKVLWLGTEDQKIHLYPQRSMKLKLLKKKNLKHEVKAHLKGQYLEKCFTWSETFLFLR